MNPLKSSLLCPVCQHGLWSITKDSSVQLWCGYGPCQSQAANDGAEGATDEEAYDRLVANIDAEDLEEEA